MTFRNIKNIDFISFSQDLHLLSPSPDLSMDELVNFYNTSLSSILESHAPVKSRTVTFSRSAPWFTGELREMKQSGRVLERTYKKSGLMVHKLAYREHRRAYARALSNARLQHYSMLINNNAGDSKNLFSTIHHFLKPQTASFFSHTDSNCNKFMHFFTSKIDCIRSALFPFTCSTPDIPTVLITQKLSHFSSTILVSPTLP